MNSSAACVDRLAQRFKSARVGVLGGELPELLEAIDELECVLADVVQLRPQAVEFGRLRVVQHQPAQKFVFAIEERERDDFIDGHDLRVTERGGEKLAEIIERRFDAFLRRAAVLHENGRIGYHRAFAVRPGALDSLLLRNARG